MPLDRFHHRFGEVHIHAAGSSPRDTAPAPVTVRHGPQPDGWLRARRARAASDGEAILLRSDLAAHPHSKATEIALAHELAHQHQRERARRQPGLPSADVAALEAEAQAASHAWTTGRQHGAHLADRGGQARLLLDDTDFDAPEESMNLDQARSDPLWVEADIIDYEVSSEAPFTFTVYYADGEQLVIPLDKMFYEGLAGSTVTSFRRHKATGRLLPFRLSFDALKALGPVAEATKMKAGDLHKLMPARFDPALTPLVIYQLNEAQLLFAMQGMAEIAGMWVGAGVGGRAAAGARAGMSAKAVAGRAAARLAARRLVARKAAAKAAEVSAAAKPATSAAAAVLTKSMKEVADELFAATASITHNGARFIKAATLLSTRSGISAADKVVVVREFARKIGFGFGKQGLLDEGASLLLHAEDSRYAFRFIKDSGAIAYGKFDAAAKDFIWTVLR